MYGNVGELQRSVKPCLRPVGSNPSTPTNFKGDVMSEEQITNRYVRGWISLSQYRAEMVAFYDREDAREKRLRDEASSPPQKTSPLDQFFAR